jgi:hypothetical protein
MLARPLLRSFLSLMSLTPILMAPARAEDVTGDFNYVIRSDELAYAGLITPASVKVLTDYLEGGGGRIVINSRGGDSASGLAIAKAMQKHPVELVVDKYCLSACANFLFIGAARKSLRPGALLGFHGDLLSYPRRVHDKANTPLASDAERAQLDARFDQARADEQAYFDGIGVDPAFFKLSTIIDPADQPHYIDIISHGKVVQRFDITEAAAAKVLMDDLYKKNGDSGWNMGELSASQKMYFPGPATLQRYGIHGLGAYPYPSSATELEQLTKTVADSEGLTGLGVGLATYGDF